MIPHYYGAGIRKYTPHNSRFRANCAIGFGNTGLMALLSLSRVPQAIFVLRK
jgi:hypothetical protein